MSAEFRKECLASLLAKVASVLRQELGDHSSMEFRLRMQNAAHAIANAVLDGVAAAQTARGIPGGESAVSANLSSEVAWLLQQEVGELASLSSYQVGDVVEWTAEPVMAFWGPLITRGDVRRVVSVMLDGRLVLSGRDNKGVYGTVDPANVKLFGRKESNSANTSA